MGCRPSVIENTRSARASELLELISQPDFSINALTPQGYTPLISAIQFLPEIMTNLLTYPEIDVGVADQYGKSALMYAIDGQRTSNSRKVIWGLLQHSSYVHNTKYRLQQPMGGGIKVCTELIYAILQKRDDVAELLLSLPETNVNTEDEKGRTCMSHLLQRTVYYWDSMQILAFKISQHPSYLVNKHHSNGTTDLTAAVTACKIQNEQDQIVDILLTHPQCDVNLRDNWGNTAYTLALQDSKLGILHQLLKFQSLDKTLVNSTDKQGRTVLHLAILQNTFQAHKSHRYSKIQQLLTEILGNQQLDVNLEDDDGETAFLYLQKAPMKLVSTDLVEKLIHHSSYKPNEIHLTGSVDIVQVAHQLPEAAPIMKSLLDLEQLDVNQMDKSLNQSITATEIKVVTALRYIQKLHKEASSQEIREILRQLHCMVLSHPSYSVNLLYPDGTTDLIWAAGNCGPQLLVRLLAIPSVDINAVVRDGLIEQPKMIRYRSVATVIKPMYKRGMTALHVACRYSDNNTTVYQILEHPSVDVNIQDSEGYTALMYAIQYKNAGVVKAILGHQTACNLTLKNKHFQTAFDLASTQNSLEPELLLTLNPNKYNPDSLSSIMNMNLEHSGIFHYLKSKNDQRRKSQDKKMLERKDTKPQFDDINANLTEETAAAITMNNIFFDDMD